MAKINLPVFAGVALLLVATNAVTATVVSHHKSDSTTTATAKKTTSFNSPADLVAKFSQTTGETVSVKGNIVQSGKDYYLVGQGKPPVGIRIDFSKSSLDPHNYITVSDGKPVAPKTYTVTGHTAITGKFTSLVVESVN